MSDIEVSFIARNNSPTSDNLIHSDPKTAQRFGFDGGALVPGLTCYAWITEVLCSPEAYGSGWTGTGRISVNYRKPVYEGEQLRVLIQETEASNTVSVAVVDAAGKTRVDGTAGIVSPDETTVPHWPDFEAPTQPYPLDAEGLLSAPWIATTPWVPTLADENELLTAIGMLTSATEADDVHPGFSGRSYRPGVARTFRRLGPSVHTSSAVQHLRAIKYDEPLTIRGRVDKIFARRGNQYVASEFVWSDQNDQPVMHAVQTRIYKLRSS